MAIDLPRSHNAQKPGRKFAQTSNPQLKLLVQLYKFLARRTETDFCKTVAKRLQMSKRNKAPLSLSKLCKFMDGRAENVAVVVGPVCDDVREFNMLKMTVCAIRFTETARKRIESAGGECLTFDQLAMRAPKGEKCTLLRGPTKSRKAEKYFGKAPGTPDSNTRPRVRSKGRKFERARGRRSSRGFKV